MTVPIIMEQSAVEGVLKWCGSIQIFQMSSMDFVYLIGLNAHLLQIQTYPSKQSHNTAYELDIIYLCFIKSPHWKTFQMQVIDLN
jgi:hypothetical protein